MCFGNTTRECSICTSSWRAIERLMLHRILHIIFAVVNRGEKADRRHNTCILKLKCIFITNVFVFSFLRAQSLQRFVIFTSAFWKRSKRDSRFSLRGSDCIEVSRPLRAAICNKQELSFSQFIEDTNQTTNHILAYHAVEIKLLWLVYGSECVAQAKIIIYV